jgi:hypothetical protein
MLSLLIVQGFRAVGTPEKLRASSEECKIQVERALGVKEMEAKNEHSSLHSRSSTVTSNIRYYAYLAFVFRLEGKRGGIIRHDAFGGPMRVANLL